MGTGRIQYGVAARCLAAYFGRRPARGRSLRSTAAAAVVGQVPEMDQSGGRLEYQGSTRPESSPFDNAVPLPPGLERSNSPPLTNNDSRYYCSRRVHREDKISRGNDPNTVSGHAHPGPRRHLPGRPERGTVDTADGPGEADGHADRGRSEPLPGLRAVRFLAPGVFELHGEEALMYDPGPTRRSGCRSRAQPRRVRCRRSVWKSPDGRA